MLVQILVTPLASLLPTLIPQAVTDWLAQPSLPPADFRETQSDLSAKASQRSWRASGLV